MGENAASKNCHKNHHLHNHHQVFDVSIDVLPQNGSNALMMMMAALRELYKTSHILAGWFVPSGTLWTASAHIITAVIGSGVLSLAWAVAQLGWVAGPAVMFLFSLVTYYTSSLLTDCYRTGDPDTGKRNYTYMDAVQSILGGVKVKLCGFIQYLGLFGIAIGYTIASSISMMAIKRSNCFHQSGGQNPCHLSSNPYMIMFGYNRNSALSDPRL
ncbi:amino acid permease 4 isoform X2 [Populus alba x Populus x berolinensis]|uniref:Amino acid permease 4 isoform X2 n=1 Tax=Populus alba x Populus x berolinensis TaxID=444605 RepID=A0AAD6VXZ7_9ROSI|nr:amino acid permease 4 isoform X2 [Populus alba x Populus x berolinensis]